MPKAIVLNDKPGFDNLILVERPLPQLRRQELLIRVRATSLNYRDVEIVRGSYHTRFALPLVPLSDGVGEVVATGDEVTRFKVGDRVCSTFWQRWVAGPFEMAEPSYQRGGPRDGLLSEYALLDEQAAVLAPRNLSDVEAATLPCAGVTAWHALISEGGIKAGETVLVQGTGGVSLFALQFAAVSGARVIVTSSSDAKIDRAKTLGAFSGVNYKTNPNWSDTVLELTEGRGVDHVIEVGGPGSFTQSLKAVCRGGQINVIGYLGGTEGAINPLDIFRRQVRVRGIPVGSRASFEAMVRAIEANNLKPVVDRAFPWTDVAEAMRYLESGAHFGKVVLEHGCPSSAAKSI
ncbi:NAD(P)-dependent alcohol dehydrogenase (plasmid) [Azospirillum oryzae]|uniref:NAD(P)-dependent alcohol dehydrogenase n=1 Tax=Azospirillum oryzae TaxID=286727 RepID=A0A6N1AT36_9PROT|nr:MULTISPECIES: NAD(P)-dependent alcohol dehydrogenase [Azospirillum]KAA0584737.1 NAD(P)-dependent alcohol dehydrogenase [Azospirillum oryzae]PWC84346.1 NADPH:quinone oxidoreductase [Azospirillum sp. TSO5]QCG99233.1 NAD(P)-dependent alcohol dehydrogenase [Azospirillum sp. TSA2s]QKS54690.1 NAD(P)-dependent alcohol dehydrogenase [Azospirillum oryzae]GLR77581.1 NADPH:quinone oxidoreductase [Azospirillum oryzae]